MGGISSRGSATFAWGRATGEISGRSYERRRYREARATHCHRGGSFWKHRWLGYRQSISVDTSATKWHLRVRVPALRCLLWSSAALAAVRNPPNSRRSLLRARCPCSGNWRYTPRLATGYRIPAVHTRARHELRLLHDQPIKMLEGGKAEIVQNTFEEAIALPV